MEQMVAQLINLQTLKEAYFKAYTDVPFHAALPMFEDPNSNNIDNIDQIKLVEDQLLAIQSSSYYTDLVRQSVYQINMDQLILRTSCNFII